jgi:NitT/TauT family transport system substrate-binding protein
MNKNNILICLILLLIVQVNAITVMAPDNPSSIPLILAADHIPDLGVKLFTNHAQAHSLFMGGKIPLLMTGYAVGESFAQRGVPVKMIASWVSGLNYLVTAEAQYESFANLKGQKIYFPFQGSPIEKLSLWLAEKEGLNIAGDLEVGYLPFVSMLEMMRQGKVRNAVMPVSSALQIVDGERYFFSFNLNDKWLQLTGSDFYPQVCLFANTNENIDQILPELLVELEQACLIIENNPQKALDLIGNRLSYSPQIIRRSLELQSFELLSGKELQAAMEQYFEKSGIAKPPPAFYQTD